MSVATTTASRGVSTRPESSPARDRLIAAATGLLAEFGVEAVNSNRIARAAGVGVGTFYGNFEDKHAAHRAVVQRAYERLADALGRAAAASAPAAGIELQVRALVEATVGFAAGEPALFRVAFGRTLPAVAKGRPALAFSIRPVERRLAALQREGRLAAELNPELAARAFAGMQSAVLLAWLDEPDRLARRDVVETLVHLHPAVAATRVAPGGSDQ